MWKVRQNSPFFKWAPFWNLISKKENNYVFWSKLSKLHKKDPILHVTTTFSLKQGETRTSSGPIPHPLKRGATDLGNGVSKSDMHSTSL